MVAPRLPHSVGRKPDESESAPLVCPYCRCALPSQFRPNVGLCRCPQCRRCMLVNDRIARMVLGEEHVVQAWTVPFAVAGPVALALVLLLPFAGSMLLAIPVCLCLMGYCAYLAYDGYLGIATGLHRFMGLSVSSGRGAAISGVWGLLVGGFGVAMMTYALVGLLFREMTGRWP